MAARRTHALTDREVAVLVKRTAESNSTLRKRDLARKAKRVLDWATDALVGRELLRMVIAGELAVLVPDDPKRPLGFRATGRSARTGARR